MSIYSTPFPLQRTPTSSLVSTKPCNQIFQAHIIFLPVQSNQPLRPSPPFPLPAPATTPLGPLSFPKRSLTSRGSAPPFPFSRCPHIPVMSRFQCRWRGYIKVTYVSYALPLPLYICIRIPGQAAPPSPPLLQAKAHISYILTSYLTHMELALWNLTHLPYPFPASYLSLSILFPSVCPSHPIPFCEIKSDQIRSNPIQLDLIEIARGHRA